MILKEEIEKYLYFCRLQKGLDEKTVKAYQNDLKQFLEYMQLQDDMLSKQALSSYVIELQQKYKKKTVKRKIASVMALLNYLVDEEMLELNPLHKVKMKFKEEIVLPKVIPKEDIERLLEYLYGLYTNGNHPEQRKKLLLRDIAVVEMLFATGMRISEVCSLQANSFDMKSGVLYIMGKGARERYLQVGNDKVMEQLRMYRQVFQMDIEQHGYFFVNRYGKPLSAQAARQMIHKHAKAVKCSINVTPHMFRHSFATYLLEEDVDIRYIQKMLGHSSITTTQIYTYVAVEKEREILRAKHPRNKMCVEKYYTE